MKKALFPLLVASTLFPLSWAGVALADQRHFDTPQQAANHLVLAIAGEDKDALTDLFGEGYRQVLPVESLQKDQLQRFLEGWADFHTLASLDARTRVLAVGERGWTFPVPIVRDVDGWRFDTVAGESEIQTRQIGRNELSAMQAALAYHDAQIEYARVDHDNDGILEYAQQFLSSPGSQDGLYWETATGEPLSPLGPLLSGYERGDDYHGYRYRILTSQGRHAPGGARSYLQQDNMVGGFGLIAWPSVYGETGVTSFMLGRNGVLYEADLGPRGADFASAVTEFDPDDRWSPVAEGFLALDD